MQKYSHDELVQLIMLNRGGYGFHKFLHKTRVKADSLLMTKGTAKEEKTGVDLFSWLNGPEGLVRVKLDEHLAEGHSTPR